MGKKTSAEMQLTNYYPPNTLLLSQFGKVTWKRYCDLESDRIRQSRQCWVRVRNKNGMLAIFVETPMDLHPREGRDYPTKDYPRLAGYPWRTP